MTKQFDRIIPWALRVCVAVGLSLSVAWAGQQPAHAGATPTSISIAAAIDLDDAGPASGIGTSPGTDEAPANGIGTSPGEDDTLTTGEVLQSAAEAAKAGKWLVMVALVLVLAVKTLRSLAASSLGKRWVPWLSTKSGGWALAFAAAAVGTLAVGVPAGLGLLDMLGAAVAAGFAAAGVHEGASDTAAGGK